MGIVCFPSTLWVLGMKLKSLGLSADAFMNGVIKSPLIRVLKLEFIVGCQVSEGRDSKYWNDNSPNETSNLNTTN